MAVPGLYCGPKQGPELFLRCLFSTHVPATDAKLGCCCESSTVTTSLVGVPVESKIIELPGLLMSVALRPSLEATQAG